MKLYKNSIIGLFLVCQFAYNYTETAAGVYVKAFFVFGKTSIAAKYAPGNKGRYHCKRKENKGKDFSSVRHSSVLFQWIVKVN